MYTSKSPSISSSPSSSSSISASPSPSAGPTTDYIGLPTANESVEWTSYNHVTPNWENVDENFNLLPPNYDDFNYLEDTGGLFYKYDQFTITPLGVSDSGTVTQVSVIAEVAASISESHFDFAAGIKIGADWYYSDLIHPALDNAYHSEVFTWVENPATTTPWDAAGVDSIVGVGYAGAIDGTPNDTMAVAAIMLYVGMTGVSPSVTVSESLSASISASLSTSPSISGSISSSVSPSSSISKSESSSKSPSASISPSSSISRSISSSASPSASLSSSISSSQSPSSSKSSSLSTSKSASLSLSLSASSSESSSPSQSPSKSASKSASLSASLSASVSPSSSQSSSISKSISASLSASISPSSSPSGSPTVPPGVGLSYAYMYTTPNM
jgi:hypothetical protein